MGNLSKKSLFERKWFQYATAILLILAVHIIGANVTSAAETEPVKITFDKTYLIWQAQSDASRYEIIYQPGVTSTQEEFMQKMYRGEHFETCIVGAQDFDKTCVSEVQYTQSGFMKVRLNVALKDTTVAVKYHSIYGNDGTPSNTLTITTPVNPPVKDLRFVEFEGENAVLSWTVPRNFVRQYKLVYFTDGIRSQNSFEQAWTFFREDANECVFGDVGTDWNCIKSYNVDANAGKRGIMTIKRPLEDMTVALYYVENSKGESPIGNIAYIPARSTYVEELPTFTPNYYTNSYPPYQPYYDVHPKAWYSEAVINLSDRHVVSGDGQAKRFRPGDSINRAEVAKMLYQASEIGLANPGFGHSLFCDVHGGEWYAPYVATLRANRWIEGYMTDACAAGSDFRPSQKLTRAEAVKLLLTAAGYGAFPVHAGDANAFRDVHGFEWFAPYVVEAYKLGYIDGYSDDTFRPYDPINRAEMAVLVNKVLFEN